RRCPTGAPWSRTLGTRRSTGSARCIAATAAHRRSCVPEIAGEIVPGLLRWTAPHLDWNPRAEPGSADDWEQMVGSVLYETRDAVALIDPLLPAEDRADFLRWLDDRI